MNVGRLKSIGIILMLLFSTVVSGQEIRPSNQPGVYNRTILLTLNNQSGRQLYYTFDEQQEDEPGESLMLPYEYPLLLSALSGEERLYRLRIFSRKDGGNAHLADLEYLIDKRAPSAPVTNLASGFLQGEQQLTFIDQADAIYYSLDGDIAAGAEEWKGESLTLKPRQKPYSLYAFSRDAAGNVSTLTSREYTIHGSSDPETARLTILSPAAGEFLNPQLLYIRSQGLDEVLYTLDGTDPRSGGLKYSESFLIEKPGNHTLTVSGRLPGGGFSAPQSVRFFIGGEQSPHSLPGSGVYTAEQTVRFGDLKARYTFEERLPLPSDLEVGDEITLFPSPRGLTHYALRLRRIVDGRLEKGQLRFFYLLDTRVPGEPIISVEGSNPYAAAPRISIFAPGYADIHYTVDGSSPSRNTPPYREPVIPEISGGTGNILIKAAAFGVNGQRGTEAAKLITYDTEAPGAPAISRLDSGDDQRLLIKVETEEGAVPVFEMRLDGMAPSVPTPASPRWKGEALEIPWGMESHLRMIFAAVDEAGNISASVPYEARLDRLPPPPPVITSADNSVLIEGTGQLYSRVIRLRSGRNIVQGEDHQPYEKPILLEPVAGQLATYRVEAYAVDESGNRSEMAYMEQAVDDRLPEVPFLKGIADRRVYNDALLQIDYVPPQEDFILRYTLGRDGEEPPPPDDTSPQLEQLRIETPAGEETYYHLKVLPAFPRRGRTGKIVSYRFVVDRRPPALPQIQGVPQDGVSTESVTVRFDGLEEGVVLYYSLLTEGESVKRPDPLVQGELYTAPIELDAEDDSEVSYLIIYTALDQAGNRKDTSKDIRIRIDKQPPELPELSGIPETGVSPEPVELTLTSTADARAEYRLFRESELARADDIPFTSYEGPVVISGINGEAVLVHFEFRSIDEAGNTSAETVRRIVAVDRRDIVQPKEPRVEYRAEDGFATISWSGGESGTIFYRLGGSQDFKPYQGPLTVALTDKQDRTLRFYLETESGLRSLIHSVELEAAAGGASSILIRGAEDQAIYGGEVVIEPVLRGSGILRYESGTDSEELRLTPYSPHLGAPISFNIPRGSVKTFKLIVGLYNGRNSQVAEATERISFTIDKAPPQPPLLTELVNPDADSPFKLIELDGRGNDVRYRLDFEEEQGTEQDYRDRLSLDTRGKAGKTVFISAYTTDAVGNRSVESAWRVLLDQDIIYVAESGNDLYEGTRLRPFRSLEKAVSVARDLKKQTLYIGSGRYPLQGGVELNWNVDFIGGLNPDSWEPEGVSLLDTGRYYPAGEAMLTLSEQHELSRLRFTDERRIVPTPIRSENGGVTLDDVDILAGSSFKLLFSQEGGTLAVYGNSLSGGTDGIIFSNRGTVTLSEVTVMRGDAANNSAVVTLRSGNLYINDSEISPGSGDRTVALDLESSYAVIANSVVRSGAGLRRSTAILQKGGETSIEQSRIVSDTEGILTIAIEASDARIDIRNSQLELAARNGATGLMLKDSVVTAEYLEIRNRNLPGYLFMVQQRGGSLELNNSTASLTARGEPILFDLTGGRLTLLHSTLLVGSERGRPVGISSRGGAQLYITNTILSALNGPAGTGLIGEKRDTWSIRSSNIGGWRVLSEYNGSQIGSAEEFNLLDGDPFGGWLNGILAEAPEASFADQQFRLREESACVDTGVTTGTELLDLDGQKRPNPEHGIRPFPDIGADEFYAAR